MALSLASACLRVGSLIQGSVSISERNAATRFRTVSYALVLASGGNTFSTYFWPSASPRLRSVALTQRFQRVFFFKQKTAYEIGLGIPAEPLFRSTLFPAPVEFIAAVIAYYVHPV